MADKNRANNEVKIGKIEIDRDLCIGAGTCVVLADKTFELDNEMKALILSKEDNTAQEIIDAAKSCPVLAIKIYDKEGNLIYPK